MTVVLHDSQKCSRLTRWGRCQQRRKYEGLCSAHHNWDIRNVTPDETYERKIVLGQIQPTWDYLSDLECETLLNGRYRGDGRRLDQYVSAEPLGIELP